MAPAAALRRADVTRPTQTPSCTTLAPSGGTQYRRSREPDEPLARGLGAPDPPARASRGSPPCRPSPSSRARPRTGRTRRPCPGRRGCAASRGGGCAAPPGRTARSLNGVAGLDDPRPRRARRTSTGTWISYPSSPTNPIRRTSAGTPGDVHRRGRQVRDRLADTSASVRRSHHVPGRGPATLRAANAPVTFSDPHVESPVRVPPRDPPLERGGVPGGHGHEELVLSDADTPCRRPGSHPRRSA